MTENTTAMKMNRAYNHLLLAILENRPQQHIDRLVGEMNFDFRTLEISEAHAREDAENFFLHYQGGHAILVKKDSPLGKILEKGKYVPG